MYLAGCYCFWKYITGYYCFQIYTVLVHQSKRKKTASLLHVDACLSNILLRKKKNSPTEIFTQVECFLRPSLSTHCHYRLARDTVKLRDLIRHYPYSGVLQNILRIHWQNVLLYWKYNFTYFFLKGQCHENFVLTETVGF